MASGLQRIMSFWLGTLVASLVLTAMLPGVVSWGLDEDEGSDEEDGPPSTGGHDLVLGPGDDLEGQDGGPGVPGDEGSPGGLQFEEGPQEDEEGAPPGTMGLGGGDPGSDPEPGRSQDQEEDEEEEKEAGDQPGDGEEDPEGDPQDDGSQGHGEGDSGYFVLDPDGTVEEVPCLQVAAPEGHCTADAKPSIRRVRQMLVPAAEDAGPDGSGPTGQEGGSGGEPFARSRTVLPDGGSDLLVWGAGVGMFAVLLGVLVRLFSVYFLGRGLFVPAGWRLDRDRVMNHPVRRDILDHLKKRPGATVQELADTAGVSNSRTAYHLSVLKREECVSERMVDGRRHFFLHAAPAVEPDRLRKRALGRADRAPGRVLTFLRQSPGATVSHVARSLGFSPGHAHYHLTRLEKEGLLDRVRRGRRVRHYLTSEGQETAAEPQEGIVEAASAVASRTDEVPA